MSKDFTGYNSIIELKTIGGKKYIDKKLRLAVSLQEAQLIVELMKKQRIIFDEWGVPTSEIVSIDIVDDDRGESQQDDCKYGSGDDCEERYDDDHIYSHGDGHEDPLGNDPDYDCSQGHRIITRELYAGSDFMDIVNKENFLHYIDKLLADIFRPYLTASTDKYLSAGIDPILRNFVYDVRKLKFVYVDFFPPKVEYQGSYTQEIPEVSNPDFKYIRDFGHNERAGVVYCFYINIVREFPMLKKFISAKIEQFVDDIDEPDLATYIKNSPLYRVDEVGEVFDIVMSIEDWKGLNYYLLRETANWICAKSTKFESTQKQIYRLTHPETDTKNMDYGAVTHENFQKIKKLLKKGLEEINN